MFEGVEYHYIDDPLQRPSTLVRSYSVLQSKFREYAEECRIQQPGLQALAEEARRVEDEAK